MNKNVQRIKEAVISLYFKNPKVFLGAVSVFFLVFILFLVFLIVLQDPSPVEDLRLERTDFDEIRLTWIDRGSADIYQIYRTQDMAEGFEVVGTTQNRHYTDKNLIPETVYYYTVTKVVGDRESGFTHVQQESTAVVGPPQNLRAEEIGDNYIQITWDGYEGSEGYTVYRADSLDTPRFPITTTTSNYYTDEDLQTNTAYYYFVTQKVRGEETDFSSQLTVATRDWLCGNSVNYDGIFYQTERVGDQCWFSGNLNYFTEDGSWCYDNDEANCERYGRLYDWETASLGGSGEGDLCPDGWRLPTDEDFKVMERHLGMSRVESNETSWRGESVNAGDRVKTAINCSDRGSDFCGNIPLGMDLGGSRSSAGAFRYLRSHGFFWTSSDLEDSAWRRLIAADEAGIHRDLASKENGFYVRCVKIDN